VDPERELLRFPDADGVLYRSAPTSEKLPRLRIASGRIQYVPRQYDRHFADLSTSYNDYLMTFSGKSRSTLRRKVKRFEQESGGCIHWKTYGTPKEIEDFYVAAREVSNFTYQERLLGAGLPEGDEFQKGMLTASRSNGVRAFLLFFEDRPIAYLYCPIENGIVMFAYLGYRPEYARLSPGTVLLWLAIESLFNERRYRFFDFTEGGDRSEHSQKRLFSTGSVPCADIYLLDFNARNLILVLSHAGIEKLSERVGGLLDRVGLKRAARRLMRNLR
jgi:hypothetical protein